MVDKAEMLARYGHMDREQIAAALGRELTAAVLDTLRAVPECVAVTLRREVAGRTWDITLTSTYWSGKDAAGRQVQAILYEWRAEEPAFTLPEDALPDEVVSLIDFETPEAALADALADLERRAGDQAA